MSEGEFRSATAPDASLPAGRKAPVVIAAAGVIGFVVGWGLSVFNPESRPVLIVMGLVVGATVGWLLGRMGSKAA